MKAAGFRAIGVRDGKEAVDIVAESQFDVALMGINMLRKSGLEATAVIRRRNCVRVGIRSYSSPGSRPMRRNPCIARLVQMRTSQSPSASVNS